MTKLSKRIENLKKEFKDNDSLKIRRFFAFQKEFALIFLESFADFDVISKDIVAPIIKLSEKYGDDFNNTRTIITEEQNNVNFAKFIAQKVLFAGEISLSKKQEDFINKLTRGEKILLIDGCEEGIIINAKKIEKRTIMEPPNNNIIRGPREGFVEDINSNLNLLRKRLVTNDLKIETMEVGRFTKSKVVICYLTKVADKKVVKKIKKRLSQIDIDGIVDSYYLQDFLEEKPNSIFKQVGWTEKPDILTGKLLEGRVGILVDGSPIALTLPFILIEDLQSAGDYYEENNSITFVRLLRFFGLFIALTMPGIYIAMQLYHYKALPLKFLVTIMNSSQNIPMPPAIEVLFAFFMFEILYEASVRTPKSLGSSFNIIGALILGDTAVKSNLASAPTIMIVALSSIAIYLIPEATNVMRLLRFFITLMATIIGVVGLCVSLVFIVAYLSDFDSYGADYLSPLAPYKSQDFKDSFVKANLKNFKTRPVSFKQKNLIRQGKKNDDEK
ncbi:MAG: spore germination protein [Christensenellales bacterium]